MLGDLNDARWIIATGLMFPLAGVVASLKNARHDAVPFTDLEAALRCRVVSLSPGIGARHLGTDRSAGAESLKEPCPLSSSCRTSVSKVRIKGYYWISERCSERVLAFLTHLRIAQSEGPPPYESISIDFRKQIAIPLAANRNDVGAVMGKRGRSACSG
jgi:hypothetical protein